MIFNNSYNFLTVKLIYFKGGSSGDTYDAAYNARMAKIAEAQQGMAEDYFDFWTTEYKPMESEQIAANRELIPYELELNKEQLSAQQELLPGQTALTSAQIAAQQELLPGQTALTSEQIAAQRSLLPQQTAYTSAQINDSLTALTEKAPVRTAFYQSALDGIDVNSRVNKAAADASQAFADSNDIMRRNAARAGVNPNSGNFSNMQTINSLNRAKAIAGARTQTRALSELENFTRLQSAMGV